MAGVEGARSPKMAVIALPIVVVEDETDDVSGVITVGEPGCDSGEAGGMMTMAGAWGVDDSKRDGCVSPRGGRGTGARESKGTESMD